MKKIKILYTINFLNNGGPSKVLLNIIKSLNKDKYDISILTIIDQNDFGVVKSLKNDGINIIEFKMKKRFLDVIKFRKQVIDTIIKLNPDIIHTHGIVTSILISTGKIKKYKITTIHDNIYEDYSYVYGKFKGNIIAYIHLKALKKFNQIICCSRTSYDVIKSKFKNISYIRNGIDTNYNEDRNLIRKKIRHELSLNDNDIVFVYGGVITKLKRVVELVTLFEKNAKKNEVLLVIGDGPLLEDAKLHANKNVKFLGFKKNILDYFSAADVYISYSSSEGFSISVIEALDSGLVLLLSDIPSHKECFEIDNSYYIGEYFNEYNFETKKNSIINNTEKNKIKEFKSRYLSSMSMTKEYEKYYMKGVK